MHFHRQNYTQSNWQSDIFGIDVKEFKHNILQGSEYLNNFKGIKNVVKTALI